MTTDKRDPCQEECQTLLVSHVQFFFLQISTSEKKEEALFILRKLCLVLSDGGQSVSDKYENSS